MKFRNVFQVNHLLKYGRIEGNDNKLIAVVYLFEKLFEVEGYALFVKDAERLSNDNRRHEENALPFFTPFEYLYSLRAHFRAVRKPPEKCMSIGNKVHGTFKCRFRYRGTFLRKRCPHR